MPILITDSRARIAFQLGMAITVAEEFAVSKEAAVEALTAQLDAAHGHIYAAHKAGLIPNAEVEKMRLMNAALDKYFKEKGAV